MARKRAEKDEWAKLPIHFPVPTPGEPQRRRAEEPPAPPPAPEMPELPPLRKPRARRGDIEPAMAPQWSGEVGGAAIAEPEEAAPPAPEPAKAAPAQEQPAAPAVPLPPPRKPRARPRPAPTASAPEEDAWPADEFAVTERATADGAEADHDEADYAAPPPGRVLLVGPPDVIFGRGREGAFRAGALVLAWLAVLTLALVR